MTAFADPSLRPFRLHVETAAIDDLKSRLARVRWPDEAPDAPWAYGTSVAFMREMVATWRDAYDWRATESALNALPQFKTLIDGIDVHFLHVPGKGPAPRPLLLSHGWPGSILEFMKVIPLLTDPAAHGGDAADAFTVVVPSLPGYTLSFTENQPRKSLPEIGAMFDTLMHRLGYARYVAQGGDWGSFVTAWLGANRPQRVAGIHLNMMPLRRDAAMFANPSPAEKTYLAELDHFLKEETGYQAIQGTRPQTLAYGLSDSPAGLAAWITEKYRAWTDCEGDPRNSLTMDEMLGNISLYWFTNCIGASFWPYYARLHGRWPIDGRVEVPTGYCAFPREILRPPREAAERVFNIRRWSVMARGGHFAALEKPRELVDEMRAFFRDIGW
ncbi:MAG: epoxide hydrolase [Burkholderiales bacterium]|nr:epoxide hydrolase [Burkholderiales bacterium]